MSGFFYVRTAEGQAAAYNATSAMPRKLRSLLKVIDGKTSSEVFESSLKAFGDVQSLLASLQKAGLIELKASAELLPPSAIAEAPEFKGKYSDISNAASGFAPTQTAQSHADTQINTQPYAPNTVWAGSRELASEASQMRQQDLQLLVQDMSSFVLAYTPEQAFTVLSELEQTSSMEQMAVLLGGYELIIRHVGEPAKIHLNHVRQILGKWL